MRQSGDGHDFRVLGGAVLQGLGVAVQGVGVLHAARQGVRSSQVCGGVQHVGVALGPGGEGRLLVGLRHLAVCLGAVQAQGGAAPGFGTTCQHHLGLAQGQQGAGVGDGVHTGAALGVHGQRWGALGQAGGQRLLVE